MNLKKRLSPVLLYRALWRWHFYAGLFVLPFLLLLALSGLLMLLSKPLEPLFYQDLFKVVAQQQSLPASVLLEKVQQQYPDAKVKLYIPPAEPTQSARFSVVSGGAAGHSGHGQASMTVYVNPYTGQMLGAKDPASFVYATLKTLHGTLLLGDFGDYLLEIAAGLAVLMVISGLYLGWPKEGWRAWIPLFLPKNRPQWRQLHRSVGLIVAIPLLLFLLSGLAWTNVWGGKLVQPWSSLPGSRFVEPETTQPHQSMNQHGQHQVPWAMEQTPMPLSAQGTAEITLNKVTQVAKQQGFTYYRVHIPDADTAVWTISATTIAGDITNPGNERTLHLDRHNADVLADYRFADYPLTGQAMAAFIPLHQGDLGLLNWLINLMIVMLVLLLLVSGTVMWWQRRPATSLGVASPSAPADISRVIGLIMLVLSLCFPLSAMLLAFAILLDITVISRMASLRKVLK